MFRRLIYVFLLTSINGCVIPVSSSCTNTNTQTYEHPDPNFPPKTSKCSTTDAVVYVLAATHKTLEDEDKKTEVNTKKAVKCSDMVGKAQKECASKESELYDPLDEL